MEKAHTPERTTVARTTFKFTKDEVVRAMLDFLKARGEKSPVFLSYEDCGVWDNSDNGHREPWMLSLQIEHTKVEN